MGGGHARARDDAPLAVRTQYILTIRFANRRFSPSVVGTVLVVVGVVLFVNLGFWQLRRADEKRQIEAAYAQGQESTVTLERANLDALPRYQKVRARGRYRAERQILLDNMPSAEGRPGYRVLTPFELEGGGVVLVDRGWIPLVNRQTDQPDIGVDENPREVSGTLDELPRPGLRVGDPAAEPADKWPLLLNFPTREMIERALGTRVGKHIVLLDAAAPDGYQRQWQRLTQLSPERHVGYAVQWFAFAFVAVVLYVVLSLRRGHDQ